MVDPQDLTPTETRDHEQLLTLALWALGKTETIEIDTAKIEEFNRTFGIADGDYPHLIIFGTKTSIKLRLLPKKEALDFIALLGAEKSESTH